MHSILTDFFGDSFYHDYHTPTYDDTVIKKDGTDMILTIDVPGTTSEDVSVTSDSGILHVSWSRKDRASRSSRDFKIGKTVNEAEITASVKDGVLSIRLPARAESLARKIPILAS